MAPQSVKATVPPIYRHIFTTVEPLLTVTGVCATIADPTAYLQALGGPTVPVLEPRLKFLYTQLCGSWLCMAFIGGVLLRLSDDRKVWLLVAAAFLVSDFVYSHSCAEAMGGWDEFIKISQWRGMDWIIFLTSAPLGVVRAMFLMKVGFRTRRADAKQK